MMPDNSYVMLVVQQLVTNAPVLIVYLVGIALALVFLRRCPLPAALAAVSLGLFLFTRIAATLFQVYLFHSGRAAMDLARIMTGVAVVTSLLHAVGLGLLLTAVFIQRTPAGDSPRTEWGGAKPGSPFGP
jgi:hypothetical protein